MQTALSKWINEIGIKNLASKLDVTAGAVGHWRSGHALPQHEEMQKIKRMSRGQLSYDTMIDSYLKNKKKR